MLMGGILVLYTGCGHFQTPEKKSIYEILAQQYVVRSKKLWKRLWSGTIFAKEKPIYEILAQRDAQAQVIEERVSREEVKEMYKGMPFNEDEEYNKEYNRLVVLYKYFEDNLEKFKDSLESWSWATLFCDINYIMTLDEMKKKVKAKFSEMKTNGLIVSRDEFEKVKENYFISSIIRIREGRDLTRIWGGEYLKSEFESKNLQGKYDVPKYVIVADDTDHIKVNLSFGNLMFPMPTSLMNASVYFIKIVGTPSALLVKDDLKPIGFVDFSEPGNVIRDNKTGKYYVIDTEFKSFEPKIKSSRIRDALRYTRKRFRYFNDNISHYTYDINLSVKTQ